MLMEAENSRGAVDMYLAVTMSHSARVLILPRAVGQPAAGITLPVDFSPVNELGSEAVDTEKSTAHQVAQNTLEDRFDLARAACNIRSSSSENLETKLLL